MPKHPDNEVPFALVFGPYNFLVESVDEYGISLPLFSSPLQFLLG